MEAIVKQYFQSDLAIRKDVVREILMRVPDMDLLDLAQGFMIPEATRQPSRLSADQALYEDGELR